MKAVLVMEMPENCLECPCGDECGDRCQAADREVGNFEDGCIDGQYGKPEWCPLVMMPERADHPHYCDNGRFDKGWNDCLDAIEGRKK